MKLSKRLEMAASFIEKGSRVADIGTDHGYLPIALVERGICPEAVAMDIGQGPLNRARENILAHGLEKKIKTRLSDGIAELVPGEADTAVMAGMGGELIIRILEQGRALWDSLESFVLAPQSELDKVRRYLEKEGFAIVRERMVLDEGKFYTAMLVKRGEMHYAHPAQYLYGKYLIEEKNPVLRQFLDKESRRIKEVLESLRNQDTEKAVEAKEKLARELQWIKEVQDEM